MTGSDLNLMVSERSITDERKKEKESRYLDTDKQAYPIIIHLRLKERKKENREKYKKCSFANIRWLSSRTLQSDDYIDLFLS